MKIGILFYSFALVFTTLMVMSCKKENEILTKEIIMSRYSEIRTDYLKRTISVSNNTFNLYKYNPNDNLILIKILDGETYYISINYYDMIGKILHDRKEYDENGNSFWWGDYFDKDKRLTTVDYKNKYIKINYDLEAVYTNFMDNYEKMNLYKVTYYFTNDYTGKSMICFTNAIYQQSYKNIDYMKAVYLTNNIITFIKGGLEAIQEMFIINPNDIKKYYEKIGDVYYESNKYIESLELYEDSFQFNTDDLDSLYKIIKLSAKIKNDQKVMYYYSNLISVSNQYRSADLLTDVLGKLSNDSDFNVYLSNYNFTEKFR